MGLYTICLKATGSVDVTGCSSIAEHMHAAFAIVQHCFTMVLASKHAADQKVPGSRSVTAREAAPTFQLSLLHCNASHSNFAATAPFLLQTFAASCQNALLITMLTSGSFYRWGATQKHAARRLGVPRHHADSAGGGIGSVWPLQQRSDAAPPTPFHGAPPIIPWLSSPAHPAGGLCADVHGM